MRAVKALASLCVCTDSHEPSLLADAILFEISCAGPYICTCITRDRTNFRFSCEKDKYKEQPAQKAYWQVFVPLLPGQFCRRTAQH